MKWRLVTFHRQGSMREAEQEATAMEHLATVLQEENGGARTAVVADKVQIPLRWVSETPRRAFGLFTAARGQGRTRSDRPGEERGVSFGADGDDAPDRRGGGEKRLGCGYSPQGMDRSEIFPSGFNDYALL